MKFRIIFFLILTTNSFGQSNDLVKCDTTILTVPSFLPVLPTFPGGQAGLTEYIDKHFNWTQRQLTVEGKVFVSFVVDIDGRINDVKVVRGLCESCDKEALRLVKGMPTWIPGIENGKAVKTKMILPIKFGL